MGEEVCEEALKALKSLNSLDTRFIDGSPLTQAPMGASEMLLGTAAGVQKDLQSIETSNQEDLFQRRLE
jgi:hypothetical protein